MRKVCVITGSRAEYGILRSLMAAIKEDPDLDLQVVAANQHLSKIQGETYLEIENDGFVIDYKVPMMVDDAPDSPNSTAKSMGRGLIEFADAYEALKPDIIVILGDRYEMLAAASAALVFKIPIAHIHGGEITEGAFDDAIRHSITKMSHLHFTSTEDYRKRVIQLGECPERVFNVGALGVENIRNVRLMSKSELEESIGFNISSKCFIVTYHPVTLSQVSSETQINNLLEALSHFQEYQLIFTCSNSDTNSRIIIQRIQDYVNCNSKRCIFINSLGQRKYFSLLRFVNAVIGNSSSGIIEVPSFFIPTLDIGDRQKGRIVAKSVIHCGISISEIIDGLIQITTQFAFDYQNPYDKPGTCKSILATIKNFPLDRLVLKTFYDVHL